MPNRDVKACAQNCVCVWLVHLVLLTAIASKMDMGVRTQYYLECCMSLLTLYLQQHFGFVQFFLPKAHLISTGHKSFYIRTSSNYDYQAGEMRCEQGKK